MPRKRKEDTRESNVNDYINKESLYKAFLGWTDREHTPMPDLVAKAILLIPENLARSGRFAGYTNDWKTDMIGDAVLSCVNAAKKFDCNKSNQPFSYLTAVAFNAFRNRLNVEHCKIYTKEAYKFNCDVVEGEEYAVSVDDNNTDDHSYIGGNAITTNINYQKNYEKKLAKKRESKKKKTPDIDDYF